MKHFIMIIALSLSVMAADATKAGVVSTENFINDLKEASDMLDDLAISCKVGVMSNYIYRGMTQSNDKVSIKADIDAFYNSFYTGATVLTIDLGTDDDFEIDYYAGYGNMFGIFTYDINIFVTSYYGNSNSSKEVALGLSWPCQMINDLILGANYAKGIDKAPDNFNLKASYDFKTTTLDIDYNDYDTVGKATSISLSKPFNMDSHILNATLKYTNFETNNAYTKDQNNLYLMAKIVF